MIKPRIGFALLCAVAATPAGANRLDVAPNISPLAIVIAVQGDQALRDIQRDAQICLRSLKPAPLDALIRDVKFERTTEIAQNAI